jgi:hypothetical protein
MRQMWRSPALWAVVLVASQYAILQLLSGAQYFDAPRNMQWGVFLSEEPRYLLDAENRYDRVNGFPPTPRELAPAGLANGRSGPLHAWWGPAYLGLFALIWRATGSTTALELLVPLAAGATVVLTFLFGARFFSARVGLGAALLLACFPNFREMATIAMVEPISALLLLAALWALLESRLWLAAGLGAAAALGKIDMIALYFGMAGLVLLGQVWQQRRITGAALRRAAVVIGGPLLLVVPWLALSYGIYGRPTTVGGGPTLATWLTVLPLMSDQIFTLGRPLTVAGVVLLVGAGVYGALRGAGPLEVRRALALTCGLGLAILLAYAAFPGASNNPRIAIPIFPLLMILAALGIAAAGPRLRLVGVALIAMLYLLGNSAGVLYQLVEGRIDRDLRPVWAALRAEPPGVVLSEHYWEAALYAHLPATWFEHDPVFQRAILHDPQALRRYLADSPIRYVVLPRDESERAALRGDPVARLYDQLPFGRALVWADEPLVAPESRAFLDATFQRREVGRYSIYTIER